MAPLNRGVAPTINFPQPMTCALMRTICISVHSHDDMWRATFLIAVVAAFPWKEASADPLRSSTCTLALDRLERLESTALAARDGRPDADSRLRLAVQAVQAQQKRAAVACKLDTDPPSPPVQARLREPVRASPIASRPAAQAPRQSTTPATSAPIGGSRTVTLSSCDEQGCWTSDGRRLQRAGSLLIGPGGFCTAHGAELRCP